MERQEKKIQKKQGSWGKKVKFTERKGLKQKGKRQGEGEKRRSGERDHCIKSD